jgi:hypothetical protein
MGSYKLLVFDIIDQHSPFVNVCRQLYYFLLVQKVTKKDTTPKNSQILLSHNQPTTKAMQNLEFTQGVDNPRTC